MIAELKQTEKEHIYYRVKKYMKEEEEETWIIL